MDKEIWKDVPGYEGLYQVSDRGNVMTVKTGRVLINGVHSNGYYKVILCREGTMKTCLVHRLVALAFIPNPESKPQVNHIDGVKSNNVLSNLEWCTSSENMRHSIEVLGETRMLGKLGANNNTSKTVIQLTKEGVEVTKYGSIMEAQRETGVQRSNISQVCLGRYKSAGGFKWSYAY